VRGGDGWVMRRNSASDGIYCGGDVIHMVQKMCSGSYLSSNFAKPC
jgi:hypothetical protein